jgi:hypothetical protein
MSGAPHHPDRMGNLAEKPGPYKKMKVRELMRWVFSPDHS